MPYSCGSQRRIKVKPLLTLCIVFEFAQDITRLAIHWQHKLSLAMGCQHTGLVTKTNGKIGNIKN